jgi:hypothetical protein
MNTISYHLNSSSNVNDFIWVFYFLLLLLSPKRWSSKKSRIKYKRHKVIIAEQTFEQHLSFGASGFCQLEGAVMRVIWAPLTSL